MGRPKPYVGSENFIFASYSHNDREKVFEIILEMQQRGYRIWFDAAIRPGHEWDDEVAQKIKECSCFVSFMSENYIRSENCKDELSYARDLEKTRVIVQLEPVEMSGGMAMRNKRVQQISKYSYNSADDFFEDFSYANNVASCIENTAAIPSLPPVSDTPATLNDRADDTAEPSDSAEKASAPKRSGVDETAAQDDSEKEFDKIASPSDTPEEPAPAKENDLVTQIESFVSSQNESHGYAFISYCSQRPDEAIFVSDFLKNNGINIWIAPERIQPGQDYPEEIMKGINDCSCFVLILTEQAMASRDVKAELHQAFNKDKPILTLEFDSNITDTFSYYLSNAQRQHITTLDPDSEQMQRFLSAVVGCTGQKMQLQKDVVPAAGQQPPAETPQATADTPAPDIADAEQEDTGRQVNADAPFEEAIAAYGDRIPASAFKGRTDLTRIILPEGVTQIEPYAFAECPNLTEVRLPEGLKSIPKEAFRNCTSLVSVIIPETVTSIGINAFRKCTSLQKVFIPDSVTYIADRAFEECTALTSVRLPNGIEELEEFVFDECTSLTEITIPDSVTEIGKYAFADCSALAVVKFSEKLTSIGHAAFQSTAIRRLRIPDSVTHLGNWAFQKCKELKSVSMPIHLKSMTNIAFAEVSSSVFSYRTKSDEPDASVEPAASVAPVASETPATPDAPVATDSDSTSTPLTANLIALLSRANSDILPAAEPEDPETAAEEELPPAEHGSDVLHIPAGTTVIEKDAYRNRTDITAVIFPEGLLEIGVSAFAGCTNLQSVSLPDGVHTIRRNAFKDCSALQSVHLPASVRIIDKWAFKECAALAVINLPDTLETLGEMAFKGCSSLREIHIPSTLTSIAQSAFSSCCALTAIDIPDSVTEICDYAFKDCSSALTVTWPDKLTSVGNWAFKGCSALKCIRLPETVTSIGNNAFSECSDLTELYLPKGLTTVGNWAFKDCDALKTVALSKQIRSECYRLFGNVSASVFSVYEDDGHGSDDGADRDHNGKKTASDPIADHLRKLLGGVAEEDSTPEPIHEEPESGITADDTPAVESSDPDPTPAAADGTPADTVETQQSAQTQDNTTPPPAPPAECLYYYASGGQRFGPYTFDAVVQLIKQDTIKSNTDLWKAGMDTWAKANTFSELAHLFAPLPPLPPV